jgi:hypothetical protein
VSTYRILVTGWRHWPEERAFVVDQALDAVQWDAGHGADLVVVHGNCLYGGVDLYADRWAKRAGVTVEPHPADRSPNGQILGPLRNSQMVALGARICLAFPGPKSRGTWDCVRKAVDADLPIRVIGWCSAFDAQWKEETE